MYTFLKRTSQKKNEMFLDVLKKTEDSKDGDLISSTPDFSLVLNQQATGPSFGNFSTDNESDKWATERARLNHLISERTKESLGPALKSISSVVDLLDLYAPSLKGLQEVHAFVCDQLESLVFDHGIDRSLAIVAAFLYGRVMAMSILTESAVPMAIRNITLKSELGSLSLSILLGVEISNSGIFENHLDVLYQQVSNIAFGPDNDVAKEAILQAMKRYTLSESPEARRLILTNTHNLLQDALKNCQNNLEAVLWTCLILEHIPLALRLDMCRNFNITAIEVFQTLSSRFSTCGIQEKKAICGALPILTTWETMEFCEQGQVELTVEFLLSAANQIPDNAMRGLAQLSRVILDRFEPFLEHVGQLALDHLPSPASQHLLTALLVSMGPVSQEIITKYLYSPPKILLSDTQLLVYIATLLPVLNSRITECLSKIIQEIMEGNKSISEVQAVLGALGVFPVQDDELVSLAQRLIMWSLDEERGQDTVVAALQLAIIPGVVTPQNMRNITYKAAQLLLADDPKIVLVSLSVLSNPSLASMLDERSCNMILLALHQSFEPSIQIVAAKLLTHLTLGHRAIVQPLAWSHIRQSLSLMDFLIKVDPARATVEACIISNLLYDDFHELQIQQLISIIVLIFKLPSLHQKYVGPVKNLILEGLKQPKEGHSLSLVFQGLANLAKFEGWGSAKQSQLALDLLEMARELPKDSQHAALNAVSRLLSIPQEGLDGYEILLNVHATFGGNVKLDADIKALVSSIYGHLGTIERNPVLIRDSKAAINREMSHYNEQIQIECLVAESRYLHGSTSQTYINTLVSKTLSYAASSIHMSLDDRATLFETMTALAALQPKAITGILPELPELLLNELHEIEKDLVEEEAIRGGYGGGYGGLGGVSGGAGIHSGLGGPINPVATSNQIIKDKTKSMAVVILLLSCTLNISPVWLKQYWIESAEAMSKTIKNGNSLAVIRGAHSRAHHAFVTRLDGAQSPQEIDQIVYEELSRCRKVLTRSLNNSSSSNRSGSKYRNEKVSSSSSILASKIFGSRISGINIGGNEGVSETAMSSAKIAETLHIVLHCSIITHTMSRSGVLDLKKVGKWKEKENNRGGSRIPRRARYDEEDEDEEEAGDDEDGDDEWVGTEGRKGREEGKSEDKDIGIDRSLDVSWALIPALDLAEAGKSVKDRQIGYRCLCELLPAGDSEVGLLLVNTVRKDLTSTTPSHILLALEAIISISSPYLAPAVGRTLVHLSKHKNLLIRRRAIVAIATLTSRQLSNEPLVKISRVIRWIQREVDSSILVALLNLARALVVSHSVADMEATVGRGSSKVDVEEMGCLAQVVLGLVQREKDDEEGQERAVVKVLIELIPKVPGIAESPNLLNFVSRLSARPNALIDCCKLVQSIHSSSTTLGMTSKSAGSEKEAYETLTRPIIYVIGSLLSTPLPNSTLISSPSNSMSLAPLQDQRKTTTPLPTATTIGSRLTQPNAHFLALRCLRLLPSEIWAEGQLSEIAMSRVMRGVDSRDATIRRETIRLLNSIDPILPQQTITTLLTHSVPRPNSSSAPMRVTDLEESELLHQPKTPREKASRALEVCITASESSASYTQRAEEICSGLKRCVETVGGGVWDDGITTVLEFLRNNTILISPFVTAAFAPIVASTSNNQLSIDQTTITIVASLSCEYPVPPETASNLVLALTREDTIVDGKNIKLSNGVTEVVLVALVALAAAGVDIDVDLIKAKACSSKRRDQVVRLIKQGLAQKVVDKSQSKALPDILGSILSLSRDLDRKLISSQKDRNFERESRGNSSHTRLERSATISSRERLSKLRDKEDGGLRYDAYPSAV